MFYKKLLITVFCMVSLGFGAYELFGAKVEMEGDSVRLQGNVGIGTPSPQAKLQAEGPVFFLGGTGDVDKNGAIDIADLLKFLAIIGNGSTREEEAILDANGDGILNWDDLGLLMKAVGTTGVTDADRRTIRRVYGACRAGVFYVDSIIGIRVSNPSHPIEVYQNSPSDPIADAWTTYSSREYKEDIYNFTDADYKDALNKLIHTSVVRFKYKGQGELGKQKIGVIAEEVPSEILAEGDTKATSLNGYISLLHAALIAQQKEIDLLKSRIKEIEEVK